MTEFERRTAVTEIRVDGRKLSGTVMRFGDVSPSHRERFEPGSLRMAEAVHLDLFHDPERAVAWHPKRRAHARQRARRSHHGGGASAYPRGRPGVGGKSAPAA